MSDSPFKSRIPHQIVPSARGVGFITGSKKPKEQILNNRIGTMLCFAITAVLTFTCVWPAAAASPASISAGEDGNSPQPLGQTDYLSIPAAAFTPISQNYNYENHGRYIKAFGGVSKFRAPVYLPTGSVIKRISACFFDNSNATSGTLKMAYLPLNAGVNYEISHNHQLDQLKFPNQHDRQHFCLYMWITLLTHIGWS